MLTDTPASGWPARVIAELDASDRHAAAIAGGLTADQFNWKPAPGSWSVGQCLHHLYVVNEVYLPPIAEALAGQANAPVSEITPGWFGRWFIRQYIDPSPQSGKARAPGKITPAPHLEPSVLDQFVQSNVAVRDLVRRAAPLDVNRIRFRNPFIGLLRFTVGTGFEIIWRHQRRHLLQAERVKQSPNFPR